MLCFHCKDEEATEETTWNRSQPYSNVKSAVCNDEEATEETTGNRSQLYTNVKSAASFTVCQAAQRPHRQSSVCAFRL